jgi:uncharacterized protein (TIGR03083 family)
MTTDDAVLDELLGAYALDAVEPDEAAAVEQYVERAPHAADELARLRNAAAWVGATEALAPPPGLLDTVLAAARERRPTSPDDPFLDVYLSETGRLDALIDTLPADALDVRTFNGLTVHELVIHLAAMESSLAAALGSPTEPGIVETDVEPRTAAFIERYGDRPLADARALWQESIHAVRRWAVDPANAHSDLRWLALHLSRDSMLVTRSFETWTHADDIRRALERPLEPPTPSGIQRMADLSIKSMPAALELTGRPHRGKTARVVLTGEGGGDWLIPLGFSEASESPDVVLTADVVEWCRVASERRAPEALLPATEGDPTLADDLAAASSAFATL